MSSKKVLVTGGTGFVGKAVVSALVSKEFDIIAPVRKRSMKNPEKATIVEISDLSDINLNLLKLHKPRVLIHIAAKAHSVNVSSAEFRKANTAATLNLARAAAEAGADRFIFVSSIGVNGNSTVKPFCVNDSPKPIEDYAISKLEAEIGLKKIADETDMQIVIIRPPLVYGPSAPGNFGKLASLAKKNLPLPLGAIHNKRSFVSLYNLVDFITVCVVHPKAANQTFLISDDQDVSTTELLEIMTYAAGNKPRLLPIPSKYLKLLAKVFRKQTMINKLCDNLQIDVSYTKEVLDWRPLLSVEEGIRRCFEDEVKN